METSHGRGGGGYRISTEHHKTTLFSTAGSTGTCKVFVEGVSVTGFFLLMELREVSVML